MRSYLSVVLASILVGCVPSACMAEESESRITVQSMTLGDGEKAFAVSDFNGDGYTDLVVAEEDNNTIEVLLNNGAGVLEARSDFPAGDNPTWLTALDFDRDGNNDLAIANHETASITLLRGNGDGSFEADEQSPLTIETAPHSHMIGTADFDSDGRSDLIVDSRDKRGVFVLRSTAGGEFRTSGRDIDVGGAPYLGFAIGDANNDGKPDIVTPNQNDISVLLNETSDALDFERARSIPFPSPFAVAVGDVTGDGHADVIAAGLGAQPGVTVFNGDGEGEFGRSRSFPMNEGAKTMAMGDVNGDGLVDVAITSWTSQVFLITGGTEDLIAVELPINGLQNPWGVTFADFDQNGRDEVVVGDATSARVNIYSLNILER